MLRHIDTPGAPVPRTEDDAVIERVCATCATDVRYEVPAGTPMSLLRYLEAVEPECDRCLAEREAREDQAQARKLRRRRVEASGLPRTLQGLRWEDYELSARGAEKLVRGARAWARGETRRPGVLVHGPVGVGKTRLAATAAWELLLHRDVRWVSVPDLIVRLGASFTDKDRAQAIKVLTGKGALVLDDLDKVKPSAWVLSNLFTAIDSRYQAGAPLFVTSNLKPSELVGHFTGSGQDQAERRVAAEAIVSRLSEHCAIGRLEGPDRRRS